MATYKDNSKRRAKAPAKAIKKNREKAKPPKISITKSICLNSIKFSCILG